MIQDIFCVWKNMQKFWKLMSLWFFGCSFQKNMSRVFFFTVLDDRRWLMWLMPPISFIFLEKIAKKPIPNAKRVELILQKLSKYHFVIIKMIFDYCVFALVSWRWVLMMFLIGIWVVFDFSLWFKKSHFLLKWHVFAS